MHAAIVIVFIATETVYIDKFDVGFDVITIVAALFFFFKKKVDATLS